MVVMVGCESRCCGFSCLVMFVEMGMVVVVGSVEWVIRMVVIKAA